MRGNDGAFPSRILRMPEGDAPSSPRFTIRLVPALHSNRHPDARKRRSVSLPDSPHAGGRRSVVAAIHHPPRPRPALQPPSRCAETTERFPPGFSACRRATLRRRRDSPSASSPPCSSNHHPDARKRRSVSLPDSPRAGGRRSVVAAIHHPPRPRPALQPPCRCAETTERFPPGFSACRRATLRRRRDSPSASSPPCTPTTRQMRGNDGAFPSRILRVPEGDAPSSPRFTIRLVPALHSNHQADARKRRSVSLPDSPRAGGRRSVVAAIHHPPRPRPALQPPGRCAETTERFPPGFSVCRRATLRRRRDSPSTSSPPCSSNHHPDARKRRSVSLPDSPRAGGRRSVVAACGEELFSPKYLQAPERCA